MADILAQQIAQLMSLESQRRRAAIDSLATTATVAGRSPLAGPPGLTLSSSSPASTSDAASTSSEPVYLNPELTRPDQAMKRSDSFRTDSTTDCGVANDSVSDTVSESAKEEEKREITTLKIKNLPRRCTQAEILAAVNEVGFEGTYDFFFLPLGGQQARQNRGYAFINFKDSATANNFRVIFHRYHIREKLVEVVAAPVQGLDENVDRYTQLAQQPDAGTAKAIMLVL